MTPPTSHDRREAPDEDYAGAERRSPGDERDRLTAIINAEITKRFERMGVRDGYGDPDQQNSWKALQDTLRNNRYLDKIATSAAAREGTIKKMGTALVLEWAKWLLLFVSGAVVSIWINSWKSKLGVP